MKTCAIGIETHYEIHASAPGSRLVILPQAAHLANIEVAGGFNHSLGDFLRSAS